MKIVKESLFEKFTEDSDPIYDMGIGLPLLLKDIKDKIYNKAQEIIKKRGIRIADTKSGGNLYTYILGKNKQITKYKNTEYKGKIQLNYNYAGKVISTIYILPNRINIQVFNNAYADKNLNILNKEKFVTNILKELNIFNFFKSYEIFDDNIIVFYIKSQYVKYFNDLNESFVEDSDPIKDMNIGTMHLIKKFIYDIYGYDIMETNYIETCAEEGKIEFVKYLLQQKIYNDKSLDDALDYAAEYGHLEIVKMLVEEGADVDSSNGYPLRNATHNGFIEVVKYLLDNGADPSYYYYQAVEDSIEYDNIFKLYVNYLKDNHIDIEIVNKGILRVDGITLDITIPDHLLNYLKGVLNEKFIEDSDPIADMGIGMMKKIKDFISNTYGTVINENKYIQYCARKQLLNFVEYLISNNYYTERTLSDAILECVITNIKTNKNAQILKLLLETVDKKGIILYLIDKEYYLKVAIVNENIPAIKLLLRYGADPTSVNFIDTDSHIKAILKKAKAKWKNQEK